MIVEFIGSTGAGKTTVLRSVNRRLASRAPTKTSSDLVTGLVALQGITHPTVRNLIEELVGFPFFVYSLIPHRAFMALAMKLLLSRTNSAMTTINNIRSLERKLGVHKLISLKARDQIILADEGPILAAHMFIYNAGRLTADELAAFVKVVPLPDAIVYIRAPIETIVRRTLLRPDPPRELSSCTRPDMARHAEAAACLFDQMAGALVGVLPILIVDNPDMDQQRQQSVAEEVSSFVLCRYQKIHPPPNQTMEGNPSFDFSERPTDAV
ncbi:MAG TPA: hypothetical protein VKA94_10965 [Hyphomicrobiales bacterium]|nr:hypothetical protein [Hyphomicrobiales bacterium]